MSDYTATGQRTTYITSGCLDTNYPHWILPTFLSLPMDEETEAGKDEMT